MDTLLQDIRYAFRMMRKSPGFTLVAVLTLALGIGVNTAIFSLVQGVLLHSLPYSNPDRLVKITFNNPGVGLKEIPFSYPELDDVRRRAANIFDEVSVVWSAPGNLTGGKRAERLEVLAVSPNYFSMLGVTPQIGRIFGPQDVADGFAPGVVISDGLWQRNFGGDRDILGKGMQLDNDPYTIIGVLPPGFRHPGQTVGGDVEVWATAGFKADPFGSGRSQREIQGLIGRLKPGVALDQAQAGLDNLSKQIRTENATDYPANTKWQIDVQSLQEAIVGNSRPMLLTLMGAVALIILIASVNISNLLLVRAAGRHGEMSVRLAMGAGHGRIVRQMLTESIILSLIAGAAGIGTAALSLKLLLQLLPAGIPRLSEVGMNWSVLLFALGITMLTGVIFGLAPALQTARTVISSGLREGSSGSGFSSKTGRTRNLLVVSELALAVVLMIGSGLLLRTLWGVLRQDPGFNASQVVSAGVWLAAPNDPKTDKYGGLPLQVAFLRDLLRNVGAIPGVENVAVTSSLPASTTKPSGFYVSVEGRPPDAADDLRAELIRVTPDYFKVMQTPLMQGRFFTENDEPGKPLVAIIDESTARQYWQKASPIEKQIKIGTRPAQRNIPVVVVGVVKDIRHDGLDKDGVPHIYVSAYQRGGKALSVVMRTSLDSATMEPQIRRAINAVDPALPVFGVRGMTQVLESSLAPRRFSAALVGAFALLAMVLASIGIYGLLSYTVRQRSHEIGIRLALGANRSSILTLFMRSGLLLSSVGIAVGLVLGAIIAPAIASMLYGIHPIDPPVFLIVPLLLVTVAALASLIPALNASRVDPLKTLRSE